MRIHERWVSRIPELHLRIAVLGSRSLQTERMLDHGSHSRLGRCHLYFCHPGYGVVPCGYSQGYRFCNHPRDRVASCLLGRKRSWRAFANDQFNDLAQRSGFAGFVRSAGVTSDAAEFVADIAKWFVRLIALVVAFDALGLPAVSDVLRQLLLWLPNLAVAIVVLILGGLAANALAGLVRGATTEADLGNPDLLANIARVAVWAFAIVVAVNQVGIARELVNTLFMATVGAAALALGLAFGIGGRDTAAEIVRRLYERSRGAAPKIEEAAEHLSRDVQSGPHRH